MSVEQQNNIPPTGGDDMEIRLWDYIDGLATSSQKSAIEKLIAENSSWRSKYHELLEIHQLISDTELEQPSLRFTKNVMEEIAKHQIAPAMKEYINNKIIWGIALFFLTLITGFLTYGISQVAWSGGSGTNPAGIDFKQIDYSRMFDNTFLNIFMMVNIILGLMLLDRFLSSRKKTWQNRG